MGEERMFRMRRGSKTLAGVALLSSVLSGFGFFVLSPTAHSTPDHLNAFNQKYGTAGSKLDSCQTCHASSSPAKENLNAYGKDFAGANHDFGAIEPKDSDGDGVSNINEIKKRTFPGDPASK